MLEKIRERELPKIKERSISGVLQTFDFREVATSFNGGSHFRKADRVVMAWSWAAGAIDALIVFSLVCLFLFAAMLMNKIGTVTAPITGENFKLAALVLFGFLSVAYLLFLRIFLGHSLGEWACGLRLGDPRQRFSSSYSVKVLYRFTVVLMTGIIVLPVLSLITGKDLAGKISGLPLIGLSSK